MKGEEIRLTRQQLYDLVWSKPMAKLAEEYDISDVGLGKLCRRMGIPRPGRGYWLRRDAGGRSAIRRKLPQAAEAVVPEAVLRIRTTPVRPYSHLKPPAVSVQRALTNPHPLTARTSKALAQAKVDDTGRLVARGQGVFAVEVSPGLVTRALLVMDALVKALEARGHKVSASPEGPRRTVVRVQGESIELTLKERLRRSDHMPTPEERASALVSGWRSSRRYDDTPSGKLRVRFEGYFEAGVPQSWSDGSRSPVEQKLGHIVLGLEIAAESRRQERVRREAWHVERERQRRQQEEERQQREAEAQRVRELQEMARAWRSAGEIRGLLGAIERRVTPALQGEELRQWLEWARHAADQLDPLTQLQLGEQSESSGRRE